MFKSSSMIGLVLLALSSASLGQQAPYQPSCADTLKMTPDAFSDTFTKRNGDASEVGQDEAAIYWANCQHKANGMRLAAFPKTQTRMGRLRDLENQLFTAETNLAYQQAGGGTLYTHGRARFQPSIESHMGAAIKLVTSRSGAATSSAIKGRYQKALATVSANIKRIKNPTKQDLEFTTRAEWNASVIEYERAWKGILAIANAPDAASLEIVEFVAGGLWINEIVNGNR
jgi:hypothetical protein